MTEQEFEALLKRPLVEVADQGFSRGITARIERQARVGIWVDWAAVFVTFVLIVLFVPLGRLAAPFEVIGIGLGLSLPFAIACAALALTQAGLRWVAD